MPRTRREFLTYSSLGMLSAALEAAAAQTPAPPSQHPTPGAPPAFGTATAVGPDVSAATFAQAEKLVQVEMTPAERDQAAGNWRMQMAPNYEFRVGPRKVALDDTLAPATLWNPAQIGIIAHTRETDRESSFVRGAAAQAPLPSSDDAIAYATVTQLSRWIENKELRSERLTQIYLDRLQRFDPKLRCVITLTRDHALAQARQADTEIAAGNYRGPLHGIPWGAKDLLDTANIPTTYGAEPFRKRVPKANATVVARLNAAGAVLVAKLSLGALALNDIWFGGQTMNPWLLEEGSSGSSAGPGAATAAGLVGVCDRQRNRGQHREPVHALRRHRPAAHLRPRAPHRGHDAVLVARQTRPHGALRGRYDVGAQRDLRTRSRRPGQRSQHAFVSRGSGCVRPARWILPRLDEGAARDRCGPGRAGHGEETRHDARGSLTTRLAL